MNYSSAILAILMTVVTADAARFKNYNLTPNYHVQNSYHQHYSHHPNGIDVPLHRNQRPSNERVETTIEKHEVVELPTQIEIFKGQPVYGVQQQQVTFNNNENVPEMRSSYLPTAQEIENLQPPQPMKTYLPPVEPDTTTTADMPATTTISTPTTYNISPAEETTTGKQFTIEQDINDYSMTTTEIPVQAQPSYVTTTSPPESATMPENSYLLPLSWSHSKKNHFLPPFDMMLPPPAPIPQITYQQYQEQLMREQQMQQMYREQEMQAIAEIEPQHHQLDQQQKQPVAPVEPAHVSREYAYHINTAENNLRS